MGGGALGVVAGWVEGEAAREGLGPSGRWGVAASTSLPDTPPKLHTRGTGRSEW